MCVNNGRRLLTSCGLYSKFRRKKNYLNIEILWVIAVAKDALGRVKGLRNVFINGRFYGIGKCDQVLASGFWFAMKYSAALIGRRSKSAF